MSDFDTLKDTFFLRSVDLGAGVAPAIYDDNLITPLVDGEEYFMAVKDALSKVGTGADAASNSNHFIGIMGWFLGLVNGDYVPLSFLTSSGQAVNWDEPFYLEGTSPPPGATDLLTLLQDKAKAGVQVCVLGWVSSFIMDSTLAQSKPNYAATSAITMTSIQELRSEPMMEATTMLNIIGHKVGSVHCKMIIVGNETEWIGFTGGIDFHIERFARQGHPSESEFWHDVGVKVEGSSVQDMYDFFKRVWNENASRPVRIFKFEGKNFPHRINPTLSLPAKTLPTGAKGTHSVQSLTTVPKFNFASMRDKLEFPDYTFLSNSTFYIRSALRKAILAAEKYIYVEDPAYWSQEILGWIRDAIHGNADLRVILVSPSRGDPGDPDLDVYPIFCQSINHGLLENLHPNRVENIRLYRYFGDTVTVGSLKSVSVTNQGTTSRVETDKRLTNDLPQNIVKRSISFLKTGADEFPVVGNEEGETGDKLVLIVQDLPGPKKPSNNTSFDWIVWVTTHVHSKTMLVDDHWAIIGSANLTRRSLYTDLEHSIAFMDKTGQAVRDYRAKLWAELFKYPTPSHFHSIPEGLHAWEMDWGMLGSVFISRPYRLQPVKLPLTPDEPLDGDKKLLYERWKDPDSRDEWKPFTIAEFRYAL